MGSSKSRKGKKADGPKTHEDKVELVAEEESRYGLFGNLGLSVAGLRKEINSLAKAINSGEGEAEELREKLKEKMDSIFEGWLERRIGFGLSHAEKGIEIMKEKELDTTLIRKKTDGVTRELKKKAFDEAFQKLTDIRSYFDQALSPFPEVTLPGGWEIMERSMDAYEDLRVPKGKMAQPKRLFKKLVKYLQEKDFDQSLVYSNLLYTTIQHDMGEEVSRDRFKAIQSEVRSLMDTMEEFRKFGIEPEGMNRELKKLETIDPGKYSEVQTTINRLNKNVSRAEKEYFRRKGSVNILETEELVSEYGSLLDLDEQRKRAEKLKRSQTRLSPRKYMEESTDLLDDVKGILFTNFEEHVKERIKALDEGMKSIRSEDEKKRIKELQGSVQTALENKDISDAMEYLAIAESIIGQSQDEDRIAVIADRYDDFLEQYEILLNENLEIDELKEEITEIERMFLSDDISEPKIAEKVSSVEYKVRDKITDIRMDAVGRQKSNFLGLMGALNLPPERVGRFENKFLELENYAPEAVEGEFRRRMDELKNEMDEELSSYFRENYDPWAKEIQSSLDRLERDEGERKRLQSRLDEASTFHRERNYLISGEILRELRGRIETIENENTQRDLEGKIDSAEFLFEEASRAGVDVTPLHEDLEKAKELLTKGDVKKVDIQVQEIDTKIKNLWKEKKKQDIHDDIEGFKDLLGESDKLGLDLSEASDLMEEAETLFREERFDEINEVMTKARDTVISERNQFFSESAMDSIKKLKQDISTLSEMDINTMEMEALLIEAERLFMNDEYEKAYSLTLDIREQMGASRDASIKQRVQKEMDETLSKVGKLEVMGLDTRDVREYMDLANRGMSEGDLHFSMENLQKAREISDELFKTHISLTIPDTLVDVKRQMGSALEEGLELDDVQSLLDEAEDYFQNEDYDLAMDTIERAQDRFNLKRDGYYQDQYRSNLDAAEEIIGNVTGMPHELELSRDNINMARDAYERGDFEASHKLMSRVMKYLESSMDNKAQNKRREIVQTYYDEVKTLLLVCEGENIDVAEERQLFTSAGELLTRGDFDSSEQILEGVRISLNEKRIAMKKNLIENSIQTSEILLGNLYNIGVDTTYERELISQLKDALRKGDLEQCENINLKLTEILQRNQGPYMVQKVQKDLSNLRNRIVDAATRGLDVSEVQEVMTHAREQFEMGDLQSAQHNIDTANEALDDVLRDQQFADYTISQDELKKSLAELRSMGIPVDDEEELVRKGDEIARSGDMQEAISWIQIAQIGAEAKINTFRSATAEGYITQIRSYLDELESGGTDIEDLFKIYSEGLELHRRGRDDRAVPKFCSILELGEELRTLQAIDIQRMRFDDQKRTYDDLKAVGMKGSKKVNGKVQEIEALLNADSLDIDAIRSSIDELASILDKKARPYLPQLAKKRISDASKNYREIVSRGLEDPSIPGKIREAGEKFRAKLYDEADRLAREIFDDIEALRKSETGQILREEIAQVKQMLARLKTLGSDVSHADGLVSRSEAALSGGRVDNAEKLIRSVRQSVKDIVRRNMRETALETIEFVDAMIHYLKDNFSGISPKIAPSEAKLDEARELFMEKKFKAAKAKGEEARQIVERMDLANIKQFLFVFRSMQGEEMQRDVSLRLDDLQEKGTDISKARILFNKADEHFKKDEFDKGRQMITLARIMISELDQQSLRDKAFDELNAAHVDILSKKKEGANVTQAYKTYNNAKDSFSMREYKKSILLSKRASYQARTATIKG
ncbi:MAG: hypothetical protein JXA22_00990 [Candidatus Thermoplasmatota archaeon]|nr:hypothetical protein [Candidatus Thermoplasmatota archaeon]